MRPHVVHVAPVLLAAGLLLCAAAPASIPSDDAALMADFFTGTLEIDVPAGGPWSAKSYLAPDHTYRIVSTDGESRGTWAIKDGKLCTTSDRDPGPDQLKTYCNTGPGKRTGDKWRDADPVTGNGVFFHLAPGRG